jgi:hypothetical protein
MSSISVSSLVLGSLTVEVEGSDSTLALSVLGTAPASLTIELGTPGPSGVLYATAPLTYDGTTWTVGMDTSYFLRSPAVAATDGQIPAWDAATSRPVWIDNAARTLFLVGVNKTGATIPKGSAVYVSGGQGAFPIISLAQANSEATSARTIGITTAAIANNAQGNVVVAGLATKLDTSAYPEGQTLYLSPSTPGGFVTSLPTQPLHGVLIGYVTRSNNNNGAIEVHVQNYQELQELSDVLITSKTNGDLLVYNSASGVWVNSSVATLGLLTTSAAASTYQTIAGMSAYQTVAAMSAYLTTASAASIYQTQAAMSAYLTTSTASATYQTLAGMSAYLTTASASATYYPLTNPSGYITSSALAGYATEAWVTSQGYLTTAPVTSVAGKTGAVTLTTSDISGLGTMATATATDYLAKADNLAGLANTGTARTNLGLGTAAVEPATKLVPAGGTTGQVLGKLSNADWDDGWITVGGGGGGSFTVTSYTTPGSYSYTIPTGANQLLVHIFGAGGGGGSGARNNTTNIRTGGGGGGNGAVSVFLFRASDFSSPVSVVVSAGGAGGASVTTNGNGNIGATNTTYSSFGNFIAMNGNPGNPGSTTTSVSPSNARSLNYNFATASGSTGGAAASTSASNGGAVNAFALQTPTGGGGGGGAAANVTTSMNGGNGGVKTAAASAVVNGYNITVAGGSGGVPGTSLPTSGPTFTNTWGSTGGGGGGYRTNQPGQNGAAGGNPGGGGGGGGGADSGFASGAGGAGGNGAVIIFAF